MLSHSSLGFYGSDGSHDGIGCSQNVSSSGNLFTYTGSDERWTILPKKKNKKKMKSAVMAGGQYIYVMQDLSDLSSFTRLINWHSTCKAGVHSTL